MYFLLKMGIFHSYVSLPEGNDELHTPLTRRSERTPWLPTSITSITDNAGDASRDAGGDAGVRTMHRLPASSIPWPMDHPRWTGHELTPLHPGRLTWNLRIHLWKRKIIFQTIIFRFYVNLRGCRWVTDGRTCCYTILLMMVQKSCLTTWDVYL